MSRINTNISSLQAINRLGKNQSDLSRVFVNAAFHLPPDLEPGDYFLQVAITDRASRDKQPSNTQWVGFEVVK